MPSSLKQFVSSLLILLLCNDGSVTSEQHQAPQFGRRSLCWKVTHFIKTGSSPALHAPQQRYEELQAVQPQVPALGVRVERLMSRTARATRVTYSDCFQQQREQPQHILLEVRMALLSHPPHAHLPASAISLASQWHPEGTQLPSTFRLPARSKHRQGLARSFSHSSASNAVAAFAKALQSCV